LECKLEIKKGVKMKEVYVNGFGVVKKELIEVHDLGNDIINEVSVMTIDNKEIIAYVTNMKDCFALKGFLSIDAHKYIPSTAVISVELLGDRTMEQLLNG
jgi:hypothetical protein